MGGVVLGRELTEDDSQIRVYNYNTSEKITTFEAHPDYIRAIAVHPTQPFVLTASDDMTIKLWDWEKGWKNVRVFEGNSRRFWEPIMKPTESLTCFQTMSCPSPSTRKTPTPSPRPAWTGRSRSGAWVPPHQTSNLKPTRPRVSTMSTTTLTATSPTFLPPQMT